MRQIELHESEYEAVLLALGYATGAAMEKKDESLANTFVWAANALNRGNKNWAIYSLPPELKPEEIVRRFMESLK